jgi:hypothetical protein
VTKHSFSQTRKRILWLEYPIHLRFVSRSNHSSGGPPTAAAGKKGVDAIEDVQGAPGATRYRPSAGGGTTPRW